MSDEFLEEWLEHYILTNAPECRVFRENLVEIKSKLKKIDFSNGNIDNERNFEKLFIGLYSAKPNLLFRKYSIAENNPEVIKKLEMAAIYYKFQTILKNFGIKASDAGKKLKQIERSSQSLLAAFDAFDDQEIILFGAGFFIKDIMDVRSLYSDGLIRDGNDLKSNMITGRFESFRQELNFYANIRDHFKDTALGNWIQFSLSGPKENSALTDWIGGIAEIWVNDFNRSLSYSSDKLSGREQFLRFAEDCMDSLHPEITESDTIRNAFEKIRTSGKFDYLNQNHA